MWHTKIPFRLKKIATAMKMPIARKNPARQTAGPPATSENSRPRGPRPPEGIVSIMTGRRGWKIDIIVDYFLSQNTPALLNPAQTAQNEDNLPNNITRQHAFSSSANSATATQNVIFVT
jgi:hypothetical protein